MNCCKRKRITITAHAMKRLRERVKSYEGYRNWEHMASTARYEGKGSTSMTDEELEWCEANMKNIGQSCKVRLLNGFVFLFMGNNGHARTLVTVLSMKT